MPSLIVGSTGIVLHSLIGPRAEDALHGLLIVLGSHIAWSKQSALVAIGHHDNGHIVILAALVEAVLVVANHVAINARPEASKAHVTIAQLHGVHLAQLLEVLFLKMLLEGQTLLLGTLLRGIETKTAGLIAPRGKRASTLADAAVEQALGQRRSTEDAAADGTSRLAEDGNTCGVATKVRNIALNPLQGKDLVEDTVVARVTFLIFLGKFRVSHEAKCTRAVLDADDDYATLSQQLPQVATIPLGLESTTVNPYHDGQLFGSALSWCSNAQIQTVFAHHIGRTTGACGLWGHLAEGIAHANTLPRSCGLRSAPTQIANGRRCVRNGFVNGQAVF